MSSSSIFGVLETGGLHRTSVLLFAVAALAVIAIRWCPRPAVCEWRRSVAPLGAAAAGTLVLLTVELLGGTGRVHDGAPLAPWVWGCMEGLAIGALLVVVTSALARRAPTARRRAGDEPSADAVSQSRRPLSRTAFVVAGVLIVALVAQLALGLGQRADRRLLLGHALLGVAVILPLIIRLAVASVLLSPGRRLLRSVGLAATALMAVQAILGVGLLFPREALWIGPWTRLVHHGVGLTLLVLVTVAYTAARPQEHSRS